METKSFTDQELFSMAFEAAKEVCQVFPPMQRVLSAKGSVFLELAHRTGGDNGMITTEMLHEIISNESWEWGDLDRCLPEESKKFAQWFLALVGLCHYWFDAAGRESPIMGIVRAGRTTAPTQVLAQTSASSAPQPATSAPDAGGIQDARGGSQGREGATSQGAGTPDREAACAAMLEKRLQLPEVRKYIVRRVWEGRVFPKDLLQEALGFRGDLPTLPGWLSGEALIWAGGINYLLHGKQLATHSISEALGFNVPMLYGIIALFEIKTKKEWAAEQKERGITVPVRGSVLALSSDQKPSDKPVAPFRRRLVAKRQDADASAAAEHPGRGAKGVRGSGSTGSCKRPRRTVTTSGVVTSTQPRSRTTAKANSKGRGKSANRGRATTGHRGKP